jgi:hypothetical protein
LAASIQDIFCGPHFAALSLKVFKPAADILLAVKLF